MPLARFESLEKSLKTRILDVSKVEFSTHGFDGASYNKIIQKIGISKGSMYYYFENKEDLFVTCFLDEALATGSFGFGMDSFLLTEDILTYWDSFKAVSSKQWNDVFQHPVLMSLMRQLVSLGTDHPMFRKLNAECEGLSEYGDIMGILEHGVKIGAIRNDVPLNVLIRMNTEYEMWLMQETQEGRVSEHQAVDKFFEMFKQLFETRR
ncbi:MAG: TetR/AcrR family transcriptional regulator [Candidatus Poseidonia sp.]|nr:TetR/AcrR family transcriptional regulator [Poseidonia sp.]